MSVRLGNVLYMLAYAYRMPHDSELNRLQSEEFDHASDLYAAVMIAGVERKLRTGLSRGYVTRSEDLSHPRGSISIEGSMRLAARRVKALSCIFHEYKVDTPFNRLIKAVMRLLSRDPLVAEERKTQMRLQLKSFMGVSDIRPELLEADQTAPRHAGKTDRLLHAVSFLVLDELLPNQTSPHASGRKYLSETKEERMHDLYEQFVREYYRFHYRNLKVGKEQIRWKLSSLNTSRWIGSGLIWTITFS